MAQVNPEDGECASSAPVKKPSMLSAFRKASKQVATPGAGNKQRAIAKPDRFQLADALKLASQLNEPDSAPGSGAAAGGGVLSEKYSKNSVMISYCRRNTEMMHHLNNKFRALGRDCWVDFEDIPKSVDWWESICSGIEGANACVICLSNEFLISKVCKDEVEHMLLHKKRILPIVVKEDFSWDDVSPAIAKLNFIFFSNKRLGGMPPGIDAENAAELDEERTKLFDAAFTELNESIDTDYAYLELHTTFLARANEWNKNGRDDGYLLKGSYLQVVDGFIEKGETSDPQPSVVMDEFFQASHRMAREEKMRNMLLEQMLAVEDEDNELSRARMAIQRIITHKRFQIGIIVLILVDVLLGLCTMILGMTDLGTSVTCQFKGSGPWCEMCSAQGVFAEFSGDQACPDDFVIGIQRGLNFEFDRSLGSNVTMHDGTQGYTEEYFAEIHGKTFLESYLGWTTPLGIMFLFVFLVEVMLQAVVTGFPAFFKHPGFVLDFVIITLSLILELAPSLANALGGSGQILIILRAWRVMRLFNIAKMEQKKKIHTLEGDLSVSKAQCRNFKKVIKSLEEQIEVINKRLNDLKATNNATKDSSRSAAEVAEAQAAADSEEAEFLLRLQSEGGRKHKQA